jgi:D-3-phosphoglycerate dehydrogenase
VFEQEPLDESRLRELSNVILTPHLGASTTEAQVNVAIDVAEQIAMSSSVCQRVWPLIFRT